MGRISALTEVTQLANDDYLVVLDSSANIAKKVTVANALGIPELGWTAAGETWTYSAWSSSTKIAQITVPSDATAKYQVGMRVKFNQTTDGTKYGIIQKVETTTLHVFMHDDYDFDNETITVPFYSLGYAPLGFDLDPTKWQIELYSANYSNGSPSLSPTNITSFSVPVGGWLIEMTGSSYCRVASTSSSYSYNFGISTTSATFDSELTAKIDGADSGAGSSVHYASSDIHKQKYIFQTSATTWYLIYDTGGSLTNLYFGAGNSTAKVRVTCKYI